MEPFWPYARNKENRRRAKDHCSCASTRTGHVLVQSDALLEEKPHAINDLCAAFGLDKAASEGILVRGQFDIARLSPHRFFLHFDSFLAVTLVDHEGDG